MLNPDHSLDRAVERGLANLDSHLGSAVAPTWYRQQHQHQHLHRWPQSADKRKWNQTLESAGIVDPNPKP
jgi:hypothetical protein